MRALNEVLGDIQDRDRHLSVAQVAVLGIIAIVSIVVFVRAYFFVGPVKTATEEEKKAQFQEFIKSYTEHPESFDSLPVDIKVVKPNDPTSLNHQSGSPVGGSGEQTYLGMKGEVRNPTSTEIVTFPK